MAFHRDTVTAALRARNAEIAANAETPPAEVINRAPTPDDVRAYPEYYIVDVGRTIAEATDCPHGYRLTDSCPCC